MIDRGKFNVLGIQVNAIDYEAAVEKTIQAAKEHKPFSVTALAVHGVMTGVSDKEHQYRLNQFDLVCPDGQPVRWALNNLYGCKLEDRVYGPTLTLRICEAAATQGVSVFLFGADQSMLDGFAEKLCAKFEGLKIAGRRASRFRNITPQERDELVNEIRESGAGLCFVGLGCPRQEVFTYEMCERLSMPLIAVGAAFAFHAGVLAQAPSWMQKSGLEWLFRFTREPKRLWKRYATTNPAYVALLTLQKLKIYRRNPESGVKPSQDILFG